MQFGVKLKACYDLHQINKIQFGVILCLLAAKKSWHY